jgi:hypothetical protein
MHASISCFRKERKRLPIRVEKNWGAFRHRRTDAHTHTVMHTRTERGTDQKGRGREREYRNALQASPADRNVQQKRESSSAALSH